MHQETKELTGVSQALQPSPLLRPVASPTQLIERHKEITVLIQQALEDGTDYGPIPGTNGKNVLLKPGAERLAVAFGCHPEYKVSVVDADHDRVNQFIRYGKPEKSFGFYRYVIACDLIKDGRVVGNGIGSCSTMESKYISRPRDMENTVLKMASKRALVAAVLNTFALSDRFTQDVEDMQEEKEQKPSAIYTRSKEQEGALLEILKKNGIPEEKHMAINEAMMGRPGKDLPQVMREIHEPQ